MKMLKCFIFALLLDGSMQMVKNYKVSFLCFELENFILILSMDMLKGFIFILLLKVIDREKENGRV